MGRMDEFGATGLKSSAFWFRVLLFVFQIEIPLFVFVFYGILTLGLRGKWHRIDSLWVAQAPRYSLRHSVGFGWAGRLIRAA